MSEKHVVVNGATCKCKFSVDPQTDILQVKSQSKHFANNKEADKKLVATTKELGQTMQKNTFGQCKKQPTGNSYLPCKTVVTKWSGFYEKVTLSNQGKILVENSKATCPIGGSDCIEITKHGQKAEVGKQQMQKADQDVVKQINPLLNLDELDEDSFFY